MNNLRNLLLRMAILVCLLALPTAALASTIEFAGTPDDKGVHLHSQGRVNFQWVPVTGSSGAPGDPVNNEYWGANDLRVFDAIGRTFGAPGYQLQAGDSFSGLNYNLAMWFDRTYLPNIESKNQTPTGYTTWDFSANLHITSISFPDAYHMVIGGQITNMLNRLTGSAVLSDLAAAQAVDFTINIVGNSRTPEGGLLYALNSSDKSAWGNISGSLVPGGGAAVPEPGSLLLFGSAAGLLGWWRRRQQKTREAAA
ncbi:MAG: PEP-CTERM sorting domain-containing protein [Desulfarculus sp.]|nr:PEP-CTERM sorting domain-containing protein [Desulfarculus sp.]